MQNFLKASLGLIIAGIMTLFSISEAKAVVTNNGQPEGRLVGTVKANNSATIYLYEQVVGGTYTIAAYTLKDNRYVKENAFKVKGKYCPVIKSVKCDTWASSAPGGAYFVFNKSDNTLYLPLIVTEKSYYAGAYHDLVTSTDRYLVYKFDGSHFVYKRTDGGFWLHQDLRSFKSLLFIGKTKDYLVRIDKTRDGYRYSAWKAKNDMTGKPDLVLTGTGTLGHGGQVDLGYSFDNNGYIYEIWTDDYPSGPVLKVLQGKKLIMQQQMRVIVSNKYIP